MAPEKKTELEKKERGERRQPMQGELLRDGHPGERLACFLSNRAGLGGEKRALLRGSLGETGVNVVEKGPILSQIKKCETAGVGLKKKDQRHRSHGLTYKEKEFNHESTRRPRAEHRQSYRRARPSYGERTTQKREKNSRRRRR